MPEARDTAERIARARAKNAERARRFRQRHAPVQNVIEVIDTHEDQEEDHEEEDIHQENMITDSREVVGGLELIGNRDIVRQLAEEMRYHEIEEDIHQDINEEVEEDHENHEIEEEDHENEEVDQEVEELIDRADLDQDQQENEEEDEEDEDHENEEEEDEEDEEKGILARRIISVLCRDEEWGCDSHGEGYRGEEGCVSIGELIEENKDRLKEVIDEEDILDKEKAEEIRRNTNINDWRKVFEDWEESRPESRRLRLDCGVEAGKVVVSYDIDSVMGYLEDLDQCRRGMVYYAIPDRRKRIDQDIHLRVEVGRRKMRFDKISMLELGYIGDLRGGSLYICFPNLEMGVSGYMKDEEMRKWQEKVWMRVLNEEVRVNDRNHLVTTWEYGKTIENVNKERRGVAGGEDRMMRVGYELGNEVLGNVWRRVKEVIEEEEMEEFKDCFVFFNVIGTKLRVREYVEDGEEMEECLLRVMDKGLAWLDGVVDVERLRNVWWDIGREDSDEEDNFLHWRLCCVDREVEEMRRLFGSDGVGKKVRWIQHFMGETGSLTYETSGKSKLRKYGLIYRQFYGVWKEMTDVIGIQPFGDERLTDLGMDKAVYEAGTRLAGGRWSDLKKLEEGYLYSKKRMSMGLEEGKKKVYGLRQEERVSGEMYRRMREELKNRRRGLEKMVRMGEYCYVTKKEEYLKWMRMNVNKFELVFEMVRAGSIEELVSTQESQVMSMMLLMLKNFVSSRELKSTGSIWSGRGLGLKEVIDEKNAGWMKGVLDWREMDWKEGVDGNVFGGESIVMRELRRKRVLYELKEGVVRMDGLVRLMNRRRGGSRKVMKRLKECCVFVVMRFYVLEVLLAVEGDVNDEMKREMREWKGCLRMKELGRWYEDGKREMEMRMNGLGDFMFDVVEYVKWLFEERDFSSKGEERYWKKVSFRRLWERMMKKLVDEDLKKEMRELLVKMMVRYNDCLVVSKIGSFTCLGGKRGVGDKSRRRFVKLVKYGEGDEKERLNVVKFGEMGRVRDRMRWEYRSEEMPEYSSWSLVEIENWVSECDGKGREGVDEVMVERRRMRKEDKEKGMEMERMKRRDEERMRMEFEMRVRERERIESEKRRREMEEFEERKRARERKEREERDRLIEGHRLYLERKKIQDEEKERERREREKENEIRREEMRVENERRKIEMEREMERRRRELREEYERRDRENAEMIERRRVEREEWLMERERRILMLRKIRYENEEKRKNDEMEEMNKRREERCERERKERWARQDEEKRRKMRLVGYNV